MNRELGGQGWEGEASRLEATKSGDLPNQIPEVEAE